MKLNNKKRTLAGLVKIWVKRSKNRNELRRLNDRALRRDIGLTKTDFAPEINRSFWI